MTEGNVHYKTPTTSKSGQFTMRSDAATSVKNSGLGSKNSFAAQSEKKAI